MEAICTELRVHARARTRVCVSVFASVCVNGSCLRLVPGSGLAHQPSQLCAVATECNAKDATCNVHVATGCNAQVATCKTEHATQPTQEYSA